MDGRSSKDYPRPMLRYFAEVERRWLALGGWPHNGKMYGFSDPDDQESATPPFHPAFLRAVSERRGERLSAFASYRRVRDPDGVFCNDFVRGLLLCE